MSMSPESRDVVLAAYVSTVCVFDAMQVHHWPRNTSGNPLLSSSRQNMGCCRCAGGSLSPMTSSTARAQRQPLAADVAFPSPAFDKYETIGTWLKHAGCARCRRWRVCSRRVGSGRHVCSAKNAPFPISSATANNASHARGRFNPRPTQRSGS